MACMNAFLKWLEQPATVKFPGSLLNVGVSGRAGFLGNGPVPN